MSRPWLLLVLCLAFAGCHEPDKKVASETPNDATATPQESGNSIGVWATDTWSGAVSSGSQSIEDTGEWIKHLYQTAKDQGLTTANSVKEWAADDWNSQGDWQYKMLTMPGGDNESIEATLNEAGTQRWDCYHVDTSGQQWTFFMKRSRRSYLSKVPLKDLVNVLPNLSADGE